MPVPPRSLERLIGIAIPPACREEILGDLHERYAGLPRYLADSLSTVPLVILSRIRRTTDFQVLLMHAFALYLAFWGAAHLQDAAFPEAPLALLRFALPDAVTLLGLMLGDAYATPGRRWPLKPARAPLLGILLALWSQWILPADLSLPPWIFWCGAAVGLLLVCGLRMLFPPIADRPQGAGGPAFWLHLDSDPIRVSPETVRILKAAGLVAAAAVLGAVIGAMAGAPATFRPQILVAVAVVVAVFQVRRWR